MITNRADAQAHIAFCPETRHMRISFTGLSCTGMPPFSNELLALARGAETVTFDLSAIHLVDPHVTVDAILGALGTTRDDPAVEIVLGPSEPDRALAGCYHVG